MAHWHTWSILKIHLQVCICVFVVSAAIALFWHWLCDKTNLEDSFQDSRTLEMIQIIIGFTYIGVITSSFRELSQKSIHAAEMRVHFDNADTNMSSDFLYFLLGLGTHRSDRPNYEKDSWSYWKKLGVHDKWKSVFINRVRTKNEIHGNCFSWLGPRAALFTFYLCHPPVSYTESGNVVAFILIYAISITVLFSFLITMHIVTYGPLLGRGGEKLSLMERYTYDQTKHLVRRNASVTLFSGRWTTDP